MKIDIPLDWQSDSEIWSNFFSLLFVALERSYSQSLEAIIFDELHFN